jgi:succinoglycan biosynthesis protein ExoM
VTAERTRVAVAICTYRRNEPLRHLLETLVGVAEKVRPRAAVGIVICDDNPDQRARSVADDFADRFELGVGYVTSGLQNISLARNAAVEAAIELGDWVAMTDDDCEPVPEWLDSYLDVLEATGSDAATGRMILQTPAGSPSWLTDEPFLTVGMLDHPDGARIDRAGTNNSIVSASWLREHPDIRFSERLGRIGGEDMVFYRTAEKAGLHIRFSTAASVLGIEPADRCTLAYRLRSALWHGNTEGVTNLEAGDASRGRLLLRAGRRLARALVRPVRRGAGGRRPQLRYCLAAMLEAIGLAASAVGLRIDHH